MSFFALATASQLDGCYHVFVDACANIMIMIGIHTLFLFAKPSESMLHKVRGQAVAVIRFQQTDVAPV